MAITFFSAVIASFESPIDTPVIPRAKAGSHDTTIAESEAKAIFLIGFEPAFLSDEGRKQKTWPISNTGHCVCLILTIISSAIFSVLPLYSELIDCWNVLYAYIIGQVARIVMSPVTSLRDNRFLCLLPKIGHLFCFRPSGARVEKTRGG